MPGVPVRAGDPLTPRLVAEFFEKSRSKYSEAPEPGGYFHTETDNDNASDNIKVTTAELTVNYVKEA
jgi:hypothetical protein